MGEVFVVWEGMDLLQGAAIARFWWVGIYFSYLHFDRCGTTRVSFRPFFDISHQNYRAQNKNTA